MEAKKKETIVKAVVAVAVLVIVWLILRSRNGPVPVSLSQPMNGFQSPYFSTNPGIPDNTLILNGGDTYQTAGPTFNAQNTVNVNTHNINGLSNLYMPMFGLVGMTAVSG